MKRPLILLALVLIVTMKSLAPAQAQGEDIRRIAQTVVLIGIVQGNEIVGNGSGTIVSPDGLIYTNRHVVEEADSLAIFMLEDIQELPVLRYYASAIYVDDQLDFAAIQIDRDENGNTMDTSTLNLPYLTPSDSPVDVGDTLRVFGYPGIGDGYMVVTSGEVVTIQNGDISGQRMPIWYRTDSEFSGGNSGGLAVNAAGEFIGLPTWVVTEDRTDGKLGGILPIVTVNARLGLAINSEQPEVVQQDTQPPQQGQPSGDVTFTLVNQSNLDVCYVFISPTTASNWGTDQLGEAETIQPSGTRTFTVRADYYDVMFHDCAGETLLDERSIDLTQNLTVSFDGTRLVQQGQPVVENPPQTRQGEVPQGIGVSVNCDSDVSFSNGAEIIIRAMPADQTYRVTVVGIGDFDPVLAVLDSTTGEGTCIDDTELAAVYRFSTPSTGIVQGTSYGAQYAFTQTTGLAFADISLVVGGYSSTGGEFLISIEGATISQNEQGGDLYSVRLSPGLVNSGVPLTVYMGGIDTHFDPLIYLVDPNTLDVFQTNSGVMVACDDAGADGCYGDNASLVGSTINLPNNTVFNFRQTDAMLSIPVSGLDADPNNPQYLTFGLSSYQGASLGSYGVLFHMGTN